MAILALSIKNFTKLTQALIAQYDALVPQQLQDKYAAEGKADQAPHVHGALTIGNTLTRAFFLMEEIEFNAQICKHARELGNVEEIPCEQLEKLMELRKNMNVPGRHPGCKTCKNLGTENCRCKHNADKAGCSCGSSSASADEALVAAITKKVLAALGK